MEDDAVYIKIRDEISRDLKPVRPMAPVWKRLSPLPLIWILLAGLVIGGFGLRSDAEVLGQWISWSLPLMQVLIAYATVALALRLTIPGSEVASSLLFWLALLGISAHIAITGILSQLSPVRVEAGRDLHFVAVCFVFTLSLGMIPLIFLHFLSFRGLVSRPGLLGLIIGLGCGLSGEAVWRMHCPYSEWKHILVAHSGAVLATVLLGFAISCFAFRRRQTVRKSGGRQRGF